MFDIHGQITLMPEFDSPATAIYKLFGQRGTDVFSH
jgi:hypothetical protein